ncbi:MAG: SRPBCC family protein [Gemmatimonadaceae bacterium]
MRPVLAVVGVLVGLVTLVVIVALLVGRALPVRHRVSREARFAAPPAAVFAAITDVERFPEWRTGVTRVERVEDEGGRRRWRETSGGDAILYEVASEVPDERLVTRIADPSLPFGGTWTFELRPDGRGTRLTITEDGEVYSPLFRFASRYVMGHDRTIATYLKDLEARLAGRGS